MSVHRAAKVNFFACKIAGSNKLAYYYFQCKCFGERKKGKERFLLFAVRNVLWVRDLAEHTNLVY